MNRIVTFLWAVAAVAAVAALIAFTWNSIRRGTDDTATATLVFTVVAAVAATAGTVATLLGNRETAAQQRQIAADIGRLAELTEASIEEARALQPVTLVHFLVGDEAEPTDSAVLVRRHLAREVDVEAIVIDERDRAMATIPSSAPMSPGEAYAASFARLSRAIGTPVGPITEDEVSEFEGRVDNHAESLEEWLDEYQQWNRSMEWLFVTHLQFENRGRVPCTNLVVQLHFPEPFRSWEEPPDRPAMPKCPRFKRRTHSDMLGLTDVGFRTPLMSQMPYLPPIEGNVSSPRYREGSVVAEFEIDKLLHGVPESTDEPVLLMAVDDGEFDIPWQLHAENLQEPAHGKLHLEIRTESIGGPPVRSLDELLAETEPTLPEDP